MLTIESRHSDYGEDAGGYRVLRYNGEWLGRIEDRVVAQNLVEDHAALIEVLKEARDHLYTLQDASRVQQIATQVLRDIGIGE